MEITPVAIGNSNERNRSVEMRSTSTPASAQAQPAIELPPQSTRFSGATVAAFAALAGVGAIAFGAAAVISGVRSGERAPAVELESPLQQALSVLSKPTTRRVVLDGAGARVVLAVRPSATAYLVLDRLGTVPAGKRYQAWVRQPGATKPLPAGTFRGTEPLVRLSVPVRLGSLVTVTLERAGRVDAPSTSSRVVARGFG